MFNLGQILQLRFEVHDKDTKGKTELVGYVETTLTELMKQHQTIARKLSGPHKGEMGFLLITVQEKTDSTRNVALQMSVTNLPVRNNIFECNFATTYFMEIWRGHDAHNKQVKFYESELWVDEFDRAFTLRFTDSELCNSDTKDKTELHFKFISRNQYKMEDEETCRFITTLEEL